MTGGACREVHVLNRQRALRIRAADVREAALAAASYARNPQDAFSIVIVGDRKMRELNLRYAGVIGTTDVLAFDLSEGLPEGEGGVGGEVVVNAAEAVAQAAKRRGQAKRELLLYVVHGVLHLGGYRDATPAGKKRMRAAEAAVMRGLARGGRD